MCWVAGRGIPQLGMSWGMSLRMSLAHTPCVWSLQKVTQVGLQNMAPSWNIPAHNSPPSIFHVQTKCPWRYFPLSWYAIKCHSDARNTTFVYVTTKIWANASKYNWSEARGICTLFSRHWQTSKIISQNKVLEQNSSVTEQCSSRFKNVSH